jgi:hypothetical protein
LTFSNGWQLIQVYNLALSIPKHKDKYYRAEITFRDCASGVRAILNNPPKRSIDGSVVDIVYALIDQQHIPAITRDAVLKVDVLDELSQEEYESVTGEIKKMAPGREQPSP